MNKPPAGQLLPLALTFYLPMLAGAFFLKAPGLLHVRDWQDAALGLGAAGAIGSAVVLTSRGMVRRFRWGRALHEEFHAMLGALASGQILLLSLLSAFGEEILFRGVLHGRLGLWPTAGLFACLHFPYRRVLIPWSLFAFVLGVVLGLLTDIFQSLWPAIFLHFFINYFNLHDLARPTAEEEYDGP